jgi:hypothetical protein
MDQQVLSPASKILDFLADNALTVKIKAWRDLLSKTQQASSRGETLGVGHILGVGHQQIRAQ